MATFKLIADEKSNYALPAIYQNYTYASENIAKSVALTLVEQYKTKKHYMIINVIDNHNNVIDTFYNH
jgi:hypothetical protein